MGLSKTQQAYFNAAKAMCSLSDFPRVKMGAVAVYRHRIISSSYNTLKTAPIQKRYNIYRFNDKDFANVHHSLHAEINCLKSIMNSDINFREVHLYIYRQKVDGTIGMARPCPSCMALIKNLGVVNIHYTTDDGYADEHLQF